ncbi:FAD-binding monooxygenase [Streptomyces sp. V4-01]|uniref:FAD-binding monooxygenase n=1 Tax=Actinacidiphila polyblastidii TaxID=3110430 RepID=A0ABU7P914_9ACTN|nr:FAD-binding monooxygenase [Streptomyces sp. V4-01]
MELRRSAGRATPRHARDHAVVLGASMAGLLTATVLSRTYATVTIVERDALPEGAEYRRGVPQGRHIHALQASGVLIMEELLPGLRAETVAAGAKQGDLLGGIRWLFAGHRLRRTDIGQPLLFCSRPLLEGQVRARVAKLPGVSFADGHDVVALATSPDRRTVTGVRVAASGGAGGDGGERVIDADLVVDTTGRASRTPRWLEELGFQPPPVEKMTVDVGYASRSYRIPADFLHGDRLVLTGCTPQNLRGGGVETIEGDRHLVTLLGMLGDHPPTDSEGFEAFAETLLFPDVIDAIRAGEPLDDPVVFKYPASVRHHYERLRDFPEGLLVLGDAVSAFNPIYGQGMTSAALQAQALARQLAGGGAPDWRRFFRAASAVVDAPWDTATASDLVFPGVQGRRTLRTRFVNRYVIRLQGAAVSDVSLAEAFVRVAGLVASPQSLLRPDRAIRVLLRGRPSGSGEPRRPVPAPQG